MTESWTFGGTYPTLNACLGDTLSYVYNGVHNVFSLDNGAPCARPAPDTPVGQ